MTSTIAMPTRAGRRLGLDEKVRLAAEIVGLYVKTQVLLRRRRLPQVAAELRFGQHSTCRNDHDAAVRVGLRLARIVDRTLGMFPADSKCLVRSLVLLALLARRDIPASVVIGVQTDPSFHAHAWVESYGTPLTRGSSAFERLVEL